jgi:hypothetical protein
LSERVGKISERIGGPMPDQEGVNYEFEVDPEIFDPDFPTVEFLPSAKQAESALEIRKMIQQLLDAGDFRPT